MAVGQRTSPVSDRASPSAAPLTPDDQGASDPQEATRGVPEQPWFITCVYAHKRRAGFQRLWRNYCSEIPSNSHPLQRIAAPLEGDPQQSGNFRRKALTCLHFLRPCRSEPDLCRWTASTLLGAAPNSGGPGDSSPERLSTPPSSNPEFTFIIRALVVILGTDQFRRHDGRVSLRRLVITNE